MQPPTEDMLRNSSSTDDTGSRWPPLDMSSNFRDPDDARNGWLDHVLAIFNAYQHPFVLVEFMAMAWMGASVCADEELDVLVRSSQIDDIVRDLIDSGKWEVADTDPPTSYGKWEEDDRDSPSRVIDSSFLNPVPILQLVAQSSFRMKLWSEDVYFLSVDVDKIEVPDCFPLNAVLVEGHFHPGEDRGRPRLLTWPNIRFVPRYSARLVEKQTPIYIPTIPRFLDAYLDQSRCNFDELLPKWRSRSRPDVTHFVRYLYLEDSHQREKVLRELSERNRADMDRIISKFKRKPNVVRIEKDDGVVVFESRRYIPR